MYFELQTKWLWPKNGNQENLNSCIKIINTEDLNAYLHLKNREKTGPQ